MVVSGRIPDVDASELLPVINELDKSLDTVREAHPGYSIAVTGLSAIAARNSAAMIGKLNSALTIEIVFVAAFIGLAFRSLDRDADLDPAGHLPDRAVGHRALADGRRPAVRGGRGA